MSAENHITQPFERDEPEPIDIAGEQREEGLVHRSEQDEPVTEEDLEEAEDEDEWEDEEEDPDDEDSED